MAQLMTIQLNKGDSPNLGFRLQGGKDFAAPLVIQKVNGGSPAERSGLIAGDAVIKINSTDVFNLRHKDAQDVIIKAGPSFSITIQRGGSTWKPSVIPTGAPLSPSGHLNSVSPVTKTSLAAKPQPSIGAIGTGHNLAAKPFLNGTTNGGPKLVNKQYNSPVGLYSEQSIAETLSAQSEVLSTGVLGVNFKKNEKNYDATKSAVYHMLQEAEKDPRDHEIDQVDSGVISSPLSTIGGLRHVQAPESKPAPPTPQLPPGQNICADCERLIVGVFVRIKDKNLHVECFKCSTCGASLKNVGYYNINNKLYCDVHAKLAAKTNPPAPNLVPVTVPPGGKIPAGTISAALSSHSLPSVAPLSPKPSPLSPGANTTATPFQKTKSLDEFPVDNDLIDRINTVDPNLIKSLTLAAAKKRDASFRIPKIINEEKQTTGTNGSIFSYNPVKANLSSAPRPFSSVSAPLSPNNYSRPLPRTPSAAPSAPIAAPTSPSITPGYIRAKPGAGSPRDIGSIGYNITWPPLPDESESLPTASPLYFPPPSVISHQSTNFSREEEEEYSELEDYTNIIKAMDPKMSMCSAEVCNITGRRSAMECAETIIEHIETQMLVENIMGQRPKSPPPLNAEIPIKESTIAPVGSKEVKSVCPNVCNKSCCDEKAESCPLREPAELKLPHDYEKHDITIQNPVPRAWESPMVQALRTMPEIKKPNPFTQIPQKQSHTPLASALSIAPSQPFNPVPPVHTTRNPVPLPPETVPYFPPEHPIIPVEPPPPKKQPEVKPSPFVEALKIAPDRPFTPTNPAPVRKKKPDPLFEDLPKPQEKLTMLDALTTASDRSYSPLHPDIKVEEKNENKIMERRKSSIKQGAPQPFISTMVNTFEDANKPTEETHFPPVSTELQQSFEEHKIKEIKTKLSEQKCMQQECKLEQLEQMVCARQAEEIILKEPLKLSSALHKSDYLPSYQTSLEFDEEIQLPHHKNINKLLEANTKITPNTRPLLKPDLGVHIQTPPPQILKPVATISQEDKQQHHLSHHVTFQPVQDDFRPPSSACSQRIGRPLTPSMINKPPSAIPYYQQNLVATEYLAPEINVFDPKSPATSRSPSPCPPERPVSPFRKSSPRPKSPAAGPPPNPLRKVNDQPVDQTDLRRTLAKDSVSTFIPHHREKLQNIQKYEGAAYEDNKQVMEKVETFAQTQGQNFQRQDYSAKSFQAEDSKRKQVETIGDTFLSISEEQKKEQMQQLNKSASSETTFKDGVQIQRKRVVTEEMEKMHKEKTVEIEKGVVKHPFQKVNAPVIDDQQGIIGLHVTNPQPLVSRFIKEDAITALPPPQIIPKVVQPPSVPTYSQVVAPAPPSFPSKITAPQPKLPSVPVSTRNVNPNVPSTSIGPATGRQSSSVFAPKRGRGVLNVGGMVGARIPVCGCCHQQIRGPFITALGKIWCPEHFTCATPSCKRPLQDIGFVEEQGQLHCEYCFEQYLAPNCAKCNAKIKGDTLKAIGKNFHPECFNCSYCGKLFGNSPFFLEDGLPYCETDWNEMFTTKCFACGFPVEAGDRWVEALNNNYHSQCFNCTMCKKNLEGQSFFAKGGRPFCKNHAR